MKSEYIMRKLILILIAILTVSNLFCQKKGIVSNKIKSVVVFENKTDKNNKIVSKKDSESKFDANGYTTEEVEYKDGKVDKKTTYQYDENGNKIKETEYDASDKVVKVSEYKYKGNLKIEKDVYDAKGILKSKRTYQYETY